MKDPRYNIIYDHINKVYGKFTAEYMPKRIIEGLDSGSIVTRQDLMLHIWWTTSGGDTADFVARRIMADVPGIVDSDERTPPSRYRNKE